MKAIKLILLGVSLFSILPLGAQVFDKPRSLAEADSLDRVQYRVLYQLDFISDPTDREYVTQDQVRLDIGTQISKVYSLKHYQADSAATPLIETGQFPRKIVTDVVPPMILYRGYPKTLDITTDYRLPAGAPVMSYVEPKPTLQWQVKPEKREILGHSCQRAEVSFGGRQWIAWFTSEIPLSEGPYKFGGLPGLILEVADSEGDYRYTCIGIANLSAGENIVRWKWNQRPTTRKELEKIIVQLYANPEQAIKALGGRMGFKGDPMLNLPYNPIEK